MPASLCGLIACAQDVVVCKECPCCPWIYLTSLKDAPGIEQGGQKRGEKYDWHMAGGIHARRERYPSRTCISRADPSVLYEGVMQAWCLFVSGSANGGSICETSPVFLSLSSTRVPGNYRR